MNTLTHFFDWLLAASLRASLLTLATLLIQAALHRHLGARMLYALWLPVLIVLLMPVLPQSQWSIEHVFQTPPPPAQIIPAPIAPVMKPAPVVFEAVAPMPEPINWQSVLLLTWISVSAAILIFGSISFMLTLRRFKQARLPASDELLVTLAQIAREIHLRYVPRVLIASSISSPAVTGLLRPTLLLPAAFDREFTPAEARLVLKHELMHLKRGDLPLNALMCVLMALHWFNPLLWIAFFKIRADREAACDAQVLQDATRDHRIAYGHALLKVETAFCPRGLSLGFVGIFQRGAALRSRIQSIATHRAPHPAMKALIALCIVLMTFLGITRAATDTNEAPLISIEARFIELTLATEQPATADNLLAEALSGIAEIQSHEGPVKILLNDTQYQTLIRRLSQRKGTDLLSTPQVTVHSGQKGSVEVAREFTLPSGQKPSDQKVGVMLDVLPTLSGKDALDLSMAPRVVEFDGFVKAENGEQKPSYSERKADAHASMKLGQTALLDLGSKTDTQAIEENVNGIVIKSSQHFTRRLFVLVTARLAGKTVNVSSKPFFTPGNSSFLLGDSILITSMTRSDDMLTVGVDYELGSTDEATAALYMTSTTNEKSPALDARQQAVVKRGRGSLVLHHPMPAQGLPHITFYDIKTHKPFGGIYFGTAAEAAKSTALDLSYMTASAEAKSKPATNVIQTKLNNIIIPQIQFRNATVEECIEFLRIKGRDLDTTTNDPTKRGVSILIRPSVPPVKTSITLDLKNVTLGEALRYVAELAKLKMSIRSYAVIIEPTIPGGAVDNPKPKPAVEIPAGKIILPTVEFRDATLAECIDFIRIKARELDPDKRGVNIVIKPGGDEAARLTLSLKNIPVVEALRYCAELAKHKLTFDAQSYVLTPVSAEAPANNDQASSPAAPPSPSIAEAKAAELRKARPQQYDFAKANLGDVLRFLATDAGINFFALPDDNPINQRLVTFSIRSSPFEVLETLCRANALVLLLDQDRWFIRATDDPEQIGNAYVLPPMQAGVETIADGPGQIGKGYVIPKTQARVETILKDISSILGGGETKPLVGKPQPSVQFKKEQNSVYVKATRLQHTWISAYFLGLSGSTQTANTK